MKYVSGAIPCWWVKTLSKETSFEDAWADVYWVFAKDGMAFDYRASYYRERYLKVQAGVIDFEAMTLERE